VQFELVVRAHDRRIAQPGPGKQSIHRSIDQPVHGASTTGRGVPVIVEVARVLLELDQVERENGLPGAQVWAPGR
jgi:hypothetical protein